MFGFLNNVMLFWQKKQVDEKEAYKQEHKSRMASYVNGGKSPNGSEILNVYAKGDEFAVIDIKTDNEFDSFKVVIDTELEKDDDKLIERFNKIRSKFSEVKGLLYKVPNDKSIKSRMAHAVSHALTSGRDIEANNIFDSLIREINDSYAKSFLYRVVYLITVISLVVLVVSFSILSIKYKFVLFSIKLEIYLYLITAGAIGGFLSVSYRLKKMIFEKGVNWYLYMIYAFERIMISMFSAVVVYFGIRSNLVFGLVNDLKSPIYGYLLFSILAGFSETLVPNLLIKLEHDQAEKSKE